MDDREKLLTRITRDPKIMVGKPIVKGTRLTVEHIINLLAAGRKEKEILKQYPQITQMDIVACLLYASKIISINTENEPLEDCIKR